MSANPPPTTPPANYPEPTEADHEAQFASVVWFHQQRSAGAFEKYAGMHVVLLGQSVSDAVPDRDELARRLVALGESVPLTRVVMQYVPGPEDWYW